MLTTSFPKGNGRGKNSLGDVQTQCVLGAGQSPGILRYLQVSWIDQRKWFCKIETVVWVILFDLKTGVEHFNLSLALLSPSLYLFDIMIEMVPYLEEN
jgi:hypothetical protein